MLKIKLIREAKNITQDEIVKMTGIPKRSYVAYENEESDIQLSKLRKIATALNVSIGEIVGETKSIENATIEKGGIIGGKNGGKPNVKETPPIETKSEKNVTNDDSNIFSNKNSNIPNIKEMLPSINQLPSFSEPHSDYGRIMSKLKFAPTVNFSDQGAPFYDLPVSAGMVDELLQASELPTGYISMPGFNCDAYFPITGCSFEPYIYAGEIIGINFMQKWENLDPDCIYLIITYDQRMLKRLIAHPTDSTRLICISPNYREFEIDKFTIRYIHKVTFKGKAV